jgi:hypothetical protein
MKKIAISPLVLLATGCSTEPDPSTLELGLGRASAVGRVASLGLLAGSGVDAGCGTPAPACDAFPCEVAVTLVLGEACPIPLLGVGEGSILVDVRWAGPDEATVDYDATGVSVLGEPFLTVVAANLHAARDGDEIRVDFAASDTELFEESIVGVDSTSWEVAIALGGTPADPSDDVFTVEGAQEAIETTDIRTFDATDVVIEPGCPRNPVAGTGRIVDTGGVGLGSWDVSFHPACDGTADFTSGRTSRQVALRFGGE